MSDILFLQKRDRPIVTEPDWIYVNQNEDGFSINSYFLDYPEMMLGIPGSESTQYARQDFTLEPIEGANLEEQLHEAVQHMEGTYQSAALDDPLEINTSIPALPDVKNYSYALVDGTIYYRENSVMVPPHLNAAAAERVRGMIGLRDCVHRLLDEQIHSESGEAARRKEPRKRGRTWRSMKMLFLI